MTKIFVDRIDEELLEFNEDHLTCYKGKPFTGIGYVSFNDEHLGLEYETYYKDGHEHGLKRKWFKTGKPAYEVPMFRGMGHGKITEWFPNGEVKEIIIAEYGITLNRKSWDEKGNLIDEFTLEEGSTNHDILLYLRNLYKD